MDPTISGCVARPRSSVDSRVVSASQPRAGWAWGCVLIVCLFGGTGRAAESVGGTADALQRGKHLAQLLCGACHVVATDQEFPPYLTQPAPSFFEVAARPATSAQSLQRFLSSTHWDQKKIPMTMPNPQLTSEETEALTHYILSLRQR